VARSRDKGAPPSFIEPMAALGVSELPSGPEWLYEVKWDGYRALALKHGEEVQLLSRNNKPLTSAFPGIVRHVQSLKASTAILDGEIVALDEKGHPSFQALQNRATSGATFVFYAFDLLTLDGEDLTKKPLLERKARLATLAESSGVKLSSALNGTAEEVIATVKQFGLEGVVAKRRESTYQPGERNNDWKKLRLGHGQEFVIGGWNPGMRPFESILVGYYEGKKFMFAGKVRAGFNPRSRAAVWKLIEKDAIEDCPFANLPNADKKGRWGEGVTAEDMAELRWVKPRHVVQMGFAEWTRHGNLRHATFQGIRQDKAGRSVRRER